MFGKSQIKMASPGLVKVSCKDLLVYFYKQFYDWTILEFRNGNITHMLYDCKVFWSIISSISHISFMLVLIALGVVLSQIWSNKFWALKYLCMFSFQPTILSLLMVNYI